MIVVTGAAGFIGSCLIGRLNELGIGPVVAVDDFSNPAKNRNLEGKNLLRSIHRDSFIHNPGEAGKPECIFHIGARTDTTEWDTSILYRMNTEYSKKLWDYCAAQQIPLIYASSAATYGMGEKGFSDRHELIPALKPLNPYGQSKQDFDLMVLQSTEAPPFWAGLKFFNVFGPNEYHKGRMASMVMHGTRQIREKGQIRLFRSHRSDYRDGEQLRDFIYVKDVVEVLIRLYLNKPQSGIYNLGTGKARNWNDLARAIFQSLKLPVNIEYIDIPEDIRSTYQYYTGAEMDKLVHTGCAVPFASLEHSVDDYIQNYLLEGTYY